MGGLVSQVPEPFDIDLSDRNAVLKDLDGGQLSVKAIAKLIKSGKAKNIVVMTGAGLSVAAGIPDFRSPGTGLYSQLQRFNLPEPEDMFNLDFYTENPEAFCTFAKELFPGNFHPTRAHFLSPLLAKKGLLLRHYTQNIDNLDGLAGVPLEKLVEAHGSFRDAHCTKDGCRKRFPLRWVRAMIFAGVVPRCDALVNPPPPSPAPLPPKASEGTAQSEGGGTKEGTAVAGGVQTEAEKKTESGGGAKEADKGKENSEADQAGDKEKEKGKEKEKVPCNSPVKPDIVFFGESLPERFGVLNEDDMPKCDLLIVLGTSLEVMPFASLTSKVSHMCPRLLINKTPVALNKHDDTHFLLGNSGFRFFEEENYRDVFLQGTCDDGVTILCEELGWTEELNVLIKRYNSRVKEEGTSWQTLEKEQGMDPKVIQAAMKNAPPLPKGPCKREGQEGEVPRPLPIPSKALTQPPPKAGGRSPSPAKSATSSQKSRSPTKSTSSSPSTHAKRK
uniref:Deacetylase sirtuin-type domain-containing protein n=1 Tax=Chromera velia CCMP2878 TaxID=1169474 RepID=A0A0G4GAR5_9ALVE|eukprot:Cvel_21032.t1-p1 / transcript=Cvel_21032.t1 / gene=Cvel_21032 / organism=Chromera_velia_CCMP2878 / gene_product=NAD-dependent protein deacetylase sirtuin-2, putative / transcript_product=NAD-dependent protein deacetylase sirtuin-2, putative / location=Cvel_scaffold1940:8738-10540(-) / protein_length=501 / sequence_SO=supercontig / SO=protein_coding / is_pseudo=false